MERQQNASGAIAAGGSGGRGPRRLLTRDDLTDTDRDWLNLEQVFHVPACFRCCRPWRSIPAHPFPFHPQRPAFRWHCNWNARPTSKSAFSALLPIPAQIDRFVPAALARRSVAPVSCRSRNLLLLTSRLALFPGYRMKGHCAFRVLRDSDLEVEEEAEDLVREFETGAETPPPGRGGAAENIRRRAGQAASK